MNRKMRVIEIFLGKKVGIDTPKQAKRVSPHINFKNTFEIR